MSIIRVASRYAKSLLELAASESKLDQVVSDMELLDSALESRDLILLFKSPIIKANKKVSVINTLFGDKMSVLTISFLNQVVKKRRENILPEISEEFFNQYRALNNVTYVQLTTAVAADVDLMSKVKLKLEQSGVVSDTVEIKSIIDPTIIGGYILEFGDNLFDASVAYQLKKLKKSFSN